MDEFQFNDQQNNNSYPGPEGPMTPPTRSPAEKKNRNRFVALVLACVVAGGAAGAGGAALYDNFAPGDKVQVQQGQRPQVETVVQKKEGQILTPEQLYAANLPSFVGITVSTTVNIFGQTTTSAASGSGFVLSQDGYIVTNFHVVEAAAKDPSVAIEVNFASGDKFNAKLIGSAKDNDVAVLKIEATGLTPVTLGDSDQLVVGEPVYAIGNPLGELTYSFTDGMVSALDRIISTGEGATLNMLQTNCAINPGNSGGPLFDQYGQVIGITTAKYTQSQSGVSAEALGFAIPINDVKDILTDLMEHGYVTGKPYLGIQVASVSPEAQLYGIPAGAAVQYIAEGSCTEKAGMEVGDIIIKIDDTAIDSPSALTAALSTNYKAGQTATFTVLRKGEEKQLTVTFDEKNDETMANNQPPQPGQQQPQQPQAPQDGSYTPFPFPFFPW